jgi:hypothetical protein
VKLPSIVSLLPDRRILEKTIFPVLLGNPDCHRILFVGCRWYTRRYTALFAAKAYTTLDRDPGQRRHGAPRHITDSLENLAAHIGPGELDVIVCNGVVGWGLDRPNAVEQAFAASHYGLRPGGILILGWNDTGSHSIGSPRDTGPFLEDCAAAAQFDKYEFPGLGHWRYRTRSWYRHVFDFYLKRAGTACAGA